MPRLQDFMPPGPSSEELIAMYASSPDPDALARERASKRFKDLQKRKAEKEERKAREEEKLLRYKENRPKDEAEAVKFEQWRERDYKKLKEEKQRLERMSSETKKVEEERRRSVAGLDLISVALQDPSQLDDTQRAALLGYTPYPPNSEAFVKLLSSHKEYRKKRDLSYLVFSEQLSDSLRSPVLCKYMLCDGRIPDGFHVEDVQEHASFDADAVSSLCIGSSCNSRTHAIRLSAPELRFGRRRSSAYVTSLIKYFSGSKTRTHQVTSLMTGSSDGCATGSCRGCLSGPLTFWMSIWR
ncbi:hypothetical protein CC79DRAFT_168137 [Sarocladium strictum]